MCLDSELLFFNSVWLFKNHRLYFKKIVKLCHSCMKFSNLKSGASVFRKPTDGCLGCQGWDNLILDHFHNVSGLLDIVLCHLSNRVLFELFHAEISNRKLYYLDILNFLC